MFTAADYRDIVSGRRADWRAAATRGLLAACEPFYRWEIARRNRRFDRDPTAIHHVAVPVISVGNLTTGGTGKTPFVAWIAGSLRERGLRVVIVSRGYGARSGQPNDEALELAAQLPDVPHVQNPDRIAGAQTAITAHRADVLVLDDGFQHRRLHRELDIVLIDALEPFGFEHLLPRGMLREPISSLSRAHVVALARADALDAGSRSALTERLRILAPRALQIELTHRPRALLDAAQESIAVESLRDQRIAAFCGLGNPRGFANTLHACGAEIVAFREFPDHCAYDAAARRSLAIWAEPLDVSQIVCTMKDLVKLRVASLGRHRLRALAIEIELLAGRDELTSQLAAIAQRGASCAG